MDCEILQHIQRYHGPAVMTATGPGRDCRGGGASEVGNQGHFFGIQHTQDRYTTAFYQPFLSGLAQFRGVGGGGRRVDCHSARTRCSGTSSPSFEAPPMDEGIREELAGLCRAAEGGRRRSDRFLMMACAPVCGCAHPPAPPPQAGRRPDGASGGSISGTLKEPFTRWPLEKYLELRLCKRLLSRECNAFPDQAAGQDDAWADQPGHRELFLRDTYGHEALAKRSDARRLDLAYAGIRGDAGLLPGRADRPMYWCRPRSFWTRRKPRARCPGGYRHLPGFAPQPPPRCDGCCGSRARISPIFCIRWTTCRRGRGWRRRELVLAAAGIALVDHRATASVLGHGAGNGGRAGFAVRSRGCWGCCGPWRMIMAPWFCWSYKGCREEVSRPLMRRSVGGGVIATGRQFALTLGDP